MAMVILSERFAFSEKKPKEVDKKEKLSKNKEYFFNKYGYVIDSNGENHNKIKHSFSTNRLDRCNLVNNVDTPGPGKYDIPNDFHNFSLNKSNHKSFITNTPRFDTNNKNDNLPGPGSYNLTESSNKMLSLKKLFSFQKIKHLYKNCGSLQNINTIPKKNQLGFYENEKGELVQIKDLNISENIVFEKEKQFKKYKMKKIIKNPIVNWNKMSRRIITPNKNKKGIFNLDKINETDIDMTLKHNNSLKDMIKNYKSMIAPKQTTILSEIEKINKIIKEFFYEEKESDFLNEEVKAIMNNALLKAKLDKNLHKRKGKVYPINFNILKRHPQIEEEMAFGSKKKMDLQETNTLQNNNPGPGAYFDNSYRNHFINSKSLKKNYKIINEREANTETNIQKKKKTFSPSVLLGPGSYNLIKDQFDKKSFNRVGSFSNERRFYEISGNKEEENSPGPGQYNCDINWLKEYYNKKLLQKLVDSQKTQSIKRKRIRFPK